MKPATRTLFSGPVFLPHATQRIPHSANHTACATQHGYKASVQRLSLIYLVKEQSGCQNQEPEHPPIRDALSLLMSVMPWNRESRGGATRDRGSGLPAADVRDSPPRLFPATCHFDPLGSSGGATRDRGSGLPAVDVRGSPPCPLTNASPTSSCQEVVVELRGIEPRTS